MNPDPVNVTVVFGDPTVAEVGEMLLNKGRGLDDDVPPLELIPPQPASKSREPITRRAPTANKCLRFVFKIIWGLFLDSSNAIALCICNEDIRNAVPGCDR
jgi:hypothetical protein